MSYREGDPVSLVASFEQWTQNARELHSWLSDRGIAVILPFSTFGRVPKSKYKMWDEEHYGQALGNPRGTIDALREYLTSHPRDSIARWTVLAFLYDLSEPPDNEDQHPDWEEVARDERIPFRDELRALVPLVAATDINEPSQLLWEIHASCLVEEFDRAEGLIRHHQVIDSESRGASHAMLGRLHLSLALRQEPVDVADATVLSPSTISHARWAVAIDEPTETLDKSRLRDARYWFEKAVDAGVTLPAPASMALGRCLFIEENYGRAATIFQDCLDAGGLALEGERAHWNGEVNAELHLAISRSLERSGEQVRARAILDTCLNAFPTYSLAYRRLAELLINSDADYRGAYNVLDRLARVEPELESDVWVRTLRGIGGTAGEPTAATRLEEFFNAHPDRLVSVESAVKAHWPGVARLGDGGRKQWLYGCWTLWWRPPGFVEVESSSAALFFARTLEIELRDRVFDPFLVDQRQATDARAEVDRPVTRVHARGMRVWKKLLGGASPTLGEMLTEINPARESVLLVARRFKEWSRERASRFVEVYQPEEAEVINNARGVSAHVGELAHTRSDEVAVLCRKYLDALLGIAQI